MGAPLLTVNGSGLRHLLQAERDTIRAADALIEALGRGIPHVRDYGDDDEAWYEATRVHKAEIVRVTEIRRAAEQRALALLAQEGPESWRQA